MRQAERLFTSTGMSVAFTVVHTSGVCTDHDAGKQQADGLADWWTADAVTFEDTANSDSGLHKAFKKAMKRPLDYRSLRSRREALEGSLKGL